MLEVAQMINLLPAVGAVLIQAAGLPSSRTMVLLVWERAQGPQHHSSWSNRDTFSLDVGTEGIAYHLSMVPPYLYFLHCCV